MGIVYSERSQAAFDTLDLRLQRILLYIKNVLEIDHTVLEGHRDEETQNRYYNQKPQITKLKWPESAHNIFPSKAVDVVPYVRVPGERGGIHWHSTDSMIRENYYKEMVRFATIFQMVGFLLFQTETTWGGDWDNDYSLMDERWKDYPHIQLKESD